MNAKPAKSQTVDTYCRLRADIVAGRLPPGKHIKINRLCATYEASLGAVRESLSRLAAEELVIAEPQRGFRVVPVSEAELLDLVRTRIEIESLCLRRSLESGGVEWEASLQAATHRLVRTPPSPEPASSDTLVSDTWEAAHEAFHLALVAACDSPWLLRLRAILYTQAERYRRLSLRLSACKRDVDAEHTCLAKAALARDEKSLLTLMGAHLQRTASFIVASGKLAGAA